MIYYLTDEFVPKILQFCYFVNQNGEIWATPKGKLHWASPTLAKQAWAYHHNSPCKKSLIGSGYKLICIKYRKNDGIA